MYVEENDFLERSPESDANDRFYMDVLHLHAIKFLHFALDLVCSRTKLLHNGFYTNCLLILFEWCIPNLQK